MTQKIEGAMPSAIRNTAAVTSTRVASGAERTKPVEASESDSLRLTGEATGLQTLQRELVAAPAINEARVAEVKAAIDAGTYQVNPDAIASRMLELDKQLGG
ncbi:MAG: flagellar biosynthesis anti-sigma factor FlgM [Pseudoxanthomonas sp.]